MKEVEALIGERFRCASKTWVAATVRCIVVMGLMLVFCMLQLIAGIDSFSEALWMLHVVVSVFFILIVLTLTLARVSEVFEYDVLKALNTPIVMKHAQKHLGQQLLSHLHNLEWGFRVGGTIINMRLVSSVVMTALTSLVALISNAMAKQLT